MSSYWDGQPPPPSQKERIAQNGTLSYQAQTWVNEKFPLFFEPDYERPPRSKKSELVFLAVIVCALIAVSSWGLNTLDKTYPDDVVADIPRMERIADEQTYDAIIASPYGYSTGVDWQLDGDIDSEDDEYFSTVVYFEMSTEDVFVLARQAAAATYPEIAESRAQGNPSLSDPADWDGLVLDPFSGEPVEADPVDPTVIDG